MSATEYVRAIGPVARELLGEPTEDNKTKRELRWGTRGSLCVSLDKGTWHDHELGRGGGVLDLVQDRKHLDREGAIVWLQERGHIEKIEGGKRQVAWYDYRTASGVLLFQVVRFDPKDFRQRKPDGNGGWIWKMTGVQLVPYRLPEIIQAIGEKRTIYIAEGEKGVHALESLGLPATCSPAGAGKWKSHYNSIFAGADIVVLPDNDPQATTQEGELRWHPDGRPVLPGQDHAADVARNLSGIASTVRVVMLPGLPLKGDVADWVAAGGTREELSELVRQSEAAAADIGPDDDEFWDRLPAFKGRDEAEEPHPAPVLADIKTSAATWVITEPWDPTQIPRRPWIARGYLMRGAVAVLSGPGSAGKSSLVVAWSACGVVGSAFRQFKVPGATRIAVYNVEDDADEQKRRFTAMFRRLGLELTAFGDRLALIGPNQVGTLLRLGAGGEAILSTEAMDEIEAFFTEFRPDVAFFDPFVELHDADENDNTSVRAVMAFFRRLAVRFNCAVCVLHHARKGMGDPGDPDSLRGASSIVGAARVVLTLNVMSKEEAKAFGIGEEKRRNYFRLDGAKSNYAPIEDAEWFERQEIRLDNGDADEPGDGVAVAWPWKPPSMLPTADSGALNRVLDILSEPPAGWLYAPTSVGASSSRWAGAVLVRELGCSEEQAKAMVKAWLKSGLLFEEEYYDQDQRKKRKGVRVNHTKRPTE